jgi:hypothetical protein
VRYQNADLVGGPLPEGRQPPAFREPLAVEDAEDDIGVADVDR